MIFNTDFSILPILPLEKFPHNKIFYSTIRMTLSLPIYFLGDEIWISLLSLLLPTLYLLSLLRSLSLKNLALRHCLSFAYFNLCSSDFISGNGPLLRREISSLQIVFSVFMLWRVS